MIYALLLLSSLAFAQDKPLNPADQSMSADFGGSFQTQQLDQMGINIDRILRGRPKLSSYITTYGSITFATAGRGITWADGSISTSASGTQGPPGPAGPPGAGEENTYSASSKTFTNDLLTRGSGVVAGTSTVVGNAFSVGGTTLTVGIGRVGVNRAASALTKTMEVNGRFHVGTQSAREPEIANTSGDPTDASYGFYGRSTFGMYMPDDNTLAFAHKGSSAIVIGSKGGIYISTPIIQGAGPVINVKAYGAVGDGATSDQAAITYAMSVLPSTGGVLYFPSGHQYLVSSVVVSSRVTLASDAGSCQITGAGDQFCGAVLVSTTTTAPIVKYTVEGGAYSNISRSRWWVAMKNIAVRGSATVDGNSHGILGNLNDQHCVQIDNHGATIENVTLMRCGGNGLYLTSSVSGIYNNLTIQASNGNGVLIDNSSNPISASNNNNFFNSLKIDSNGGSAFRINREGQGNILNGLDCDGNNQYCIDLSAIGYGKGGTTNVIAYNRFSGIWSENNANGDVHIGTAAANNKIDFVHHTSSMTYDVNYGLNLISGSSTTGANFIDTAIYDTIGNIRTGGGFDSSDDDHLHIRNKSGTADGLVLAKRFAASNGLADNVRMPTSLPQTGAFNVYNGQGIDSRNAANSANYTMIASNSDNGVNLGDSTQGNVRVLPSTFTVGTSSFVVSGGSATLAYLMTARAFVGDGSGLTGIIAGSESNTYTSSKTFTQDVLMRGQLNVQGSSATVKYGVRAATATFSSSALVGATSGLGTNTMDVRGSLGVGTYGGTTAGPSNGMIVSGSVGIGDDLSLTPGNPKVSIIGPVRINAPTDITFAAEGKMQASSMTFVVNATTFIYTSNGYFGLGTTSPQGYFHLVSPDTTTSLTTALYSLYVPGFKRTYTGALSISGGSYYTNYLGAPTFKSSGAGGLSFSNAGTLYISGPPTAQNNITFTSSSTILFGGGVDQKIEVAVNASGGNGKALTIEAGDVDQMLAVDLEGGDLILKSGLGMSLSGTAGFDGNIILNANPKNNRNTSGYINLAPYGGNVGVSTLSPVGLFTIGNGTFTTLASGYIGIGNSDPKSKLHISSGTLIIDGDNPLGLISNSSVTASAFFGDGSHLTGISGGGETNTYTSSKTFTSDVLGKSSITASAFTILNSTVPLIHGVQKKMANATTIFYSSKTSVNITGLDFTLTNNTSYFFQYDMVVQSTLAAAGVWAGIDRPAGSTITWTVIYNTAYTGATLGSNNGTTIFSAAAGASVHGVNVNIPLSLWGTIITGNTGGIMQPVIKSETYTGKGLVQPWSRGKLELLE